MPTARGALGAVALRGRVYAFGGVTGSRNSTASEVYDPDGDTWQAVAPLPTGRDHQAAAEVDGKIYVIGGRINGSYARNLGVVEEYDPASDAWRRQAPMPTARSGIGAAALAGRIYVVGGESPEGTFAQMEVFDPASNAWGRGPDLPTPRHGLGVVAFQGRLYTLAGGPTPGGSASAAVEILEP
jgi:N-acetylneuraminic acid mutarotase